MPNKRKTIQVHAADAKAKRQAEAKKLLAEEKDLTPILPIDYTVANIRERPAYDRADVVDVTKPPDEATKRFTDATNALNTALREQGAKSVVAKPSVASRVSEPGIPLAANNQLLRNFHLAVPFSPGPLKSAALRAELREQAGLPPSPASVAITEPGAKVRK